MKPVKRFQIRPYKRELDKVIINNPFYFEVLVFEHKEAMRSYYHKYYNARGDDYHNFLGLCINTWKENTQGDIYPRIGYILLNQDNLGVGVLSHECCHAAFQYDRRLGNNSDYGDECEEAEERYAYIQGDLIRKLVIKLDEYNLFKQ